MSTPAHCVFCGKPYETRKLVEETFEITRRESGDPAVTLFNIHSDTRGWLWATGDQNEGGAYVAKTASFCLKENEMEKLLEFLAKQLNRIVYKLPDVPTTGYRRS